MSTLFKDLFTLELFHFQCDVFDQVIPHFDRNLFLDKVFTPEFKQLEMKGRITHVTHTLHDFLPHEFPEALPLLLSLTDAFKKVVPQLDKIEFLFLEDYLACYGLEHPELSMQAMERITQYVTCEFAIRPFIIKYPAMSLKKAQDWTKHSHPRVRRLASEGTRPRLPWGIALKQFQHEPALILPILTELRDDENDLVRRSVANSLNDIAKDNPMVVRNFAQEYLGETEKTDKLIKHACRTLLKQADPTTLQLFGLDSKGFEVMDFVVESPDVCIGEALSFSFKIKNHHPSKILRLEYGLYYLKNNGTLSRKVFKISERTMIQNEIRHIERKQSFKIVSTRQFYLGEHSVALIINGTEYPPHTFHLHERK